MCGGDADVRHPGSPAMGRGRDGKRSGRPETRGGRWVIQTARASDGDGFSGVLDGRGQEGEDGVLAPDAEAVVAELARGAGLVGEAEVVAPSLLLRPPLAVPVELHPPLLGHGAQLQRPAEVLAPGGPPDLD